MISVTCRLHGEIASVTSLESADAALRLHDCAWAQTASTDYSKESTHD